ncbi:unnamed protein product [Dracunculus medinensis]|uniref:Ubiquitinyl hydrolase 1 n=1 Tax=Dracunculus medinensis TaxID=318479 RepID=A0A0N4U757_DRAME|nr:unnamed protein product [Dracunculus medinensis]
MVRKLLRIKNRVTTPNVKNFAKILANNLISGVFKSGDIVWAPYRRIPEWPAIVRYFLSICPQLSWSSMLLFLSVRCIYPRKVTYSFLPDAVDKTAMKSASFSCPPSKLRHISIIDTIPNNASDELKEAFEVAVDLLKNNGKKLETTVTMKTQKRALDGSGESIASVELGSPITLTSFANIGEVVWLNVPDHLAWPVLVREVKKKFAMVDPFPLQQDHKPEIYPLSACKRFDFSSKALAGAIKRENNRELKQALQGAYDYLYLQKSRAFCEAPIDSCESIQKNIESNKLKEIRKQWNEGNLDMEDEEDEDYSSNIDQSKMISKAVYGSGSSDQPNVAIKELTIPRQNFGLSKHNAKKMKFSEDLEDLESEMNEKLNSLVKGEIAWIRRSVNKKSVKWPVLILNVDKECQTCTYLELPVDNGNKEAQERSCSTKLSNILLYDTVAYEFEDVEDDVLRSAIDQAESIIQGHHKVDIDFEEKANGENSTDAATEDISIGHGILDSDNILKYSMSYMCMRHLKAIASEQIDCSRHKTYSIPSYLPLHFDLKIGSLLDEASISCLIEYIDDHIPRIKSIGGTSSLRRLHYIVTVALPEAIIYAIMQLRCCTRSEAYRIYDTLIKGNENETGN